MTTETVAETSAGHTANVRRASRLRDYGILVALVIMVIALSLSTSTFLSTSNLINVLDQCSVVGLLAAGATVCILSGVFDLTASATLALSAIVGVKVVQHLGVLPGFAAAVLAGAVLGLVTGLVVVRSGVNSFIATLATSIVYRGLAVIVTSGVIVYPLARQTGDFGMLTWPSVFSLTSATVVFIVVVAAIGVMIAATTFGRRVYAVGGNAEAARRVGVRVGQLKVTVFVIASSLAAFAGVLEASRGFSVSVNSGGGTIALNAIAAAVIGGTSLFGGRGRVVGALLGALVISSVQNGLALIGQTAATQVITTGLILLAAVTLDMTARNRKQKGPRS
jgi:ribose transport system permease protein